jgi:hypothetical protein
MTYRLLLLAVADKRAEYFIKKYLLEQLGLSLSATQSLFTHLPGVVKESADGEALELIRQRLVELGAETQINLPYANYCKHHIEQTVVSQCQRCQAAICQRCREIASGVEVCAQCTHAKARRQRWRRYRQLTFFLILLIVIGVAASIYYQEHRKLDWDRTYDVALMEVVKVQSTTEKPSLSLSAKTRELFVKTLEDWFTTEFARTTENRVKPFRFHMLGPVVTAQLPPALPTKDDSTWVQYKQGTAFINFFNQLLAKTEINGENYDIKLYLYLYPADENLGYDRQHSVGTTRGRFGVVFLPIGKQTGGYTMCAIAHEVLHTVGAIDKYDENHISIYPEGYFQPESRYPQQYGEIMSMAIPLAPNKERDIDDLSNARIGVKTIAEIGWQPPNK